MPTPMSENWVGYLKTIKPASGITISLGRGMQQLSIAMARTIPRYPVVIYQFSIRSNRAVSRLNVSPFGVMVPCRARACIGRTRSTERGRHVNPVQDIGEG